MRILGTNLCTNAETVVTALTANASFPVANLKHPFRSKRYRSTNANAKVTYDFKVATSVDSVVLLWPKEDGIKLTSGAVITIRGSAVSNFATNLYSATLTVNDVYLLASSFFTAVTARYWQVEIADPTNPWLYIEIGHVFIGKSLTLSPAQNGFSFEQEDLSNVIETSFGHKYTDIYPLRSSLSFNYEYIDYTEIKTLDELYRSNGRTKPLMVILDESSAVFEANHFVIYGCFTGRLSLAHKTYNLLSVDGLKIEEMS